MEKPDSWDVQQFIALYNAAADQNKLYAEFRWKVFYYIALLNGSLFLVYFNNKYDSVIFNMFISIIAILFTLLLYQFEKRHHELFSVSREIAANIEEHFDDKKLCSVFSAQIKHKESLKKNSSKNWGIIFY